VDFYSRQVEARRQTRWLVIGFIIAVIAVVVALDVVLFTLLGAANREQAALAPVDYVTRNPGSALFCTLFVLAVIGFASLFKSVQLREGGGVVARALGGVRVGRDTADYKRKRLHNVVEEMAIASGVPMPEIYLLEQENGINAFAAGHTPANAAITVTQGALDRLSRDELQGVIAHEFSHVLNGDMRLNVQLMGWLFGLFVVALIGRTLLRYSPRSRKGGAGLLGAAVAVMVLGYVGLMCGRLLQAAVSRQRERLADASGVQFTRNPDGLKGALVKIAGLPEGSRITNTDPEQAAHMLFAPGMSRLFTTHPSLAERIRALDPHFDVRKLPQTGAKALSLIPAFDAAELREAMVSRAAAAPAVAESGNVNVGHEPPDAPDIIDAPVRAQPQKVSAQVGFVDTVHIEQAHALRIALPESLREFVESTGQARAVVLALLLSREPPVRERQLTLLGKGISSAQLEEIRAAAPLTDGLAPMLRLPALLQVFPALRRLPLGERQALASLTDKMIRADARIDVFEFCLAHLFATLLRDEIEARAPHGTLTLKDVTAEVQGLFVVLSSFGAAAEEDARRAYEAGMHTLYPMDRPAYRGVNEGAVAKKSPQEIFSNEREQWPRRLGAALQRLEKLQPFGKKALIEAMVATIAHDDLLSVAEAELLRTVCAALHCPLPPILPGVIPPHSGPTPT
jgi:Zn-dependent protease with chaperone function